MTVIDFKAPPPPPRHGLAGYYALADLPQRGPTSELVISTGWKEMDQIFRIYPAQFVVVTGRPGSGKSTFLLNLLCNLTRRNSYRHWLYVPENEASILDKMELIFNADSEGFGKFSRSYCFVQSACEEHYNDEPRPIEKILDMAYRAWRQDRVNTVSIDPWNELEQARLKDESHTDYIGRVLRLVKRFGRETGCTMFMVAHPTKASNDREVHLGDIEASQHWWNKCDNGLVIKREKKSATVVSMKVREQPMAGCPGHCVFKVDPETGVFSEQQGGGQVI
jgi:twinkle protein